MNVRPASGSIASRLTRHPLLWVCLLALAVRLITLALLARHGGDVPFFAEMDSELFWQFGGHLAEPGKFWPMLLNETQRMPLYPLLLAGVHRVLGDVPGAVAVIQAVVDAGTCDLIAALGALVSPLVGLIAGILAALSVTLVVISSQILMDTIFVFFFAAMLLAGAQLLLEPAPKPLQSSWARLVLAGAAGGIALMVRPVIAPLLAAALPVILIAVYRQRRRLAPAMVAASLFAVAAAAPVAPVLIRNIVHFRSFGLTSQGGEHLLLFIAPLVQQ